MNAMNKARDLVSRLVGGGRKQAEDLRDGRKRAQLIKELGQQCYDHHKGADEAGQEVDRIIEAIDALDESAEPEEQAAADINLAATDGEAKAAEQV